MTAADVLRGSAAFHADAPAHYRLLAAGPPLRRHGDQLWLCTGYAAAREVLDDARLRVGSALPAGGTPALDAIRSRWLEVLDGADHRRERAGLFRSLAAFADVDLPGAVLRARMATLDRAGDRFDVVSAFVVPLWFDLVRHWLGIPPRALVELMPHVVRVAGAVTGFAPDRDESERSAALLLEGIAALERPAHDLLGESEPVALAVRTLNLLVDAAPAVLGTAVCIGAFLADPALRAQALGDGADLSVVVAEVFRLEPVQAVVPRVASEPLRIADADIAPGERVVVVVGAANRDPAVFPDPEQLRWDRVVAPVTFGLGPHACPGRNVALSLAAAAVAAFFGRFPGALPDGEPRWSVEPMLRRYASLPVRVG